MYGIGFNLFYLHAYPDDCEFHKKELIISKDTRLLGVL